MTPRGVVTGDPSDLWLQVVARPQISNGRAVRTGDCRLLFDENELRCSYLWQNAELGEVT